MYEYLFQTYGCFIKSAAHHSSLSLRIDKGSSGADPGIFNRRSLLLRNVLLVPLSFTLKISKFGPNRGGRALLPPKSATGLGT